MAVPFDTLRLARRLEAAGFAPQPAGDMAEAIAQLATKADLATEIAALRTELKARADSNVAPGMVFVPFCYAEAAANILTNPQLDPFG
ncbi:MAG TPA: hypothetical protein VL985_15550, partial [Stellaceae bacterium]|nr:hypothetical protein [Stellaceae bacterium]